MSHFAKVNNNNIVESVQVVSNKNLLNAEGVEDEDVGIAHLTEVFGSGTWTWIKTSFNTFAGQHEQGGTPLRKNYAGIGDTYDKVRDAFIPPKPYPSWTLNEDTCQWDAPTAHPNDGKRYTWNEGTSSWDEIPEISE